MSTKTVSVSREMWKKLHELRLDWKLKTLNEVIETLVKNVESRNRPRVS